MIALFPGSFDPFTNGHLDVAERVSSSAVRELVGLKKDISRYVPPAIERFLTDNRS